MLVMSASGSYTNLPTRIALESLIGTFPSETADEVASTYYAPAPPGGHSEFNVTLVGPVMDCAVAGSPAAAFHYTSQLSQLAGGNGSGPFEGYMFVFLHRNFAYALRLEGTNGLDPRSLNDAEAILGSWSWTSP